MKHISLDIETHDPHLTDKGPSWIFGEGKIVVVGLYDCQTKRKGYIDGNGGAKVRNMLLSASTAIVGANIKYDFEWLCHEHGLKVKETKCGLIDVAVAESLIDQYQPFGLDQLALKYLKERKGIDQLVSMCAKMGLKGDPRKHILKVWESGEQGKKALRNYVVSDADQPARIWEKQKKILEDEGMMKAFDYNMRMLKLTAKMRQQGVRIDYERWQHNCEVVKPIHDKLEKQFYGKWGEVNINSPKQMGVFMEKNKVPFKWRITVRGWQPDGRRFSVRHDAFSGQDIARQRMALKEDFPSVRIEKDKIKMYVDGQYKERTLGQLEALGYNAIAGPNIDKYFIKDYKGTYPVVADLEQYKIVKSIISKFLGPKFGRFLVHHKSKKEWRLHGNFDPVGARQTGRLSSKQPNLQNIPAKTVLFEGTSHEVDLSVMCREVFLPEKGQVYVKLDFSGQENVIQAHFAVGTSGVRIRKMYNSNPRLDEHKFVGNASGLTEEYGKKNGRKYAKNVRFGVSYGMQLARMCLQFGWTKDFAQRLLDAVKDASPWFVDTMEAVQEKIKRVGFIVTLLGRKIRYRDFDDSVPWRLRDLWKVYPFYNYLVQGSAADQTKVSQVNCDESEDGETALLTVHDEGGYSLPPTQAGLKRLKQMVKLYCESIPLDVPVTVDPECGTDWAHTEGQELWTEEDVEAGKCKPEMLDYPKETLDELWARAVLLVKAGKKAKARIFDLADLDEDEEEEDEEESIA